jgi:thiosulfate reductase cytochrome b subunit
MNMAASTFIPTVEERLQLPGDAAATSRVRASAGLRHSAMVRIAHWTIVIGVLGLLVSGTGILISHPRLYWGETGAIGTPSLIDLPLPMIIGPSVWNRPIHFLFAWILVFAGAVYLVGGFATGHFRRQLLPARSEFNLSSIWTVLSNHLRWRRIPADDVWRYNVVQRLAYLGVIFVVFPGIIWTGLAMSFTVDSVFPFLVTILGGHQSARTLHFVFVSLLVIFLIIHLAMLLLVGFLGHVQAMVTGRVPPKHPA